MALVIACGEHRIERPAGRWATVTGEAHWRDVGGRSVPTRIRRRADGMEMALVVPAGGGGATLAPLYVDRTEVTQEMFDKIVPDRERPYSRHPNPLREAAILPTDESDEKYVRWPEYLRWLADMYVDGVPARLPARQLAVREVLRYAARVSSRIPTDDEFAYLLQVDAGGAKYPWGTSAPPRGRVVNCCDASFARRFPRTTYWAPWMDYDDGFPTVAPVASFPANSLGLYDISGNVKELCSVAADPGLLDLNRDEWEGHVRHMGGSCWGPPQLILACDYRADPLTYFGLEEKAGFRCVRSVASIRDDDL